MKVNETILNARKALGMTQEQVADKLGVTASAVYKWEKGAAYPDITILAPLARLLKMDLNTLLSFQQDLTSQEIRGIVQDMIHEIEKKGYDAGFEFAMGKIREYPGCDLLVSNLAASLEGAQMIYSITDTDKYKEQILHLYQGLVDSENETVRNQVNQLLFYRYFNDGKFDEAEKIFSRVSDTNAFYLQMQSDLYMSQGRSEEAKRAVEQKLLGAAGDVQSALMKLHCFALKEEDLEAAEYFAGKAQKIVEVLELWEYGAYVLYLELCRKKKDVDGCLEVFRKMFDCTAEPWNVNDSRLFRHIVQTAPAQDSTLQKQIWPMMLEELKRDEEMEFLRESEKGAAFIKEMEQRLGDTSPLL